MTDPPFDEVAQDVDNRFKAAGACVVVITDLFSD
jgi:hypothetical protein